MEFVLVPVDITDKSAFLLFDDNPSFIWVYSILFIFYFCSFLCADWFNPIRLLPLLEHIGSALASWMISNLVASRCMIYRLQVRDFMRPYQYTINKLSLCMNIILLAPPLLKPHLAWYGVYITVSSNILLSVGVVLLFLSLDSFTTSIVESAVAVYFRVQMASLRIFVIRKIVEGSEISVCFSTNDGNLSADVCSICHESLNPIHTRKHSNMSRFRLNLAFDRSKSYGAARLFHTACGHLFHRKCFTRWIAEKPIRMHVPLHPYGSGPQNSSQAFQDRASCPLCKAAIQLHVSDYTFNTFRFVLSGPIN